MQGFPASSKHSDHFIIEVKTPLRGKTEERRIHKITDCDLFRDLSEAAIESLTALFIKCWKSGSIPKKLRTAKTILIPKPGKQPRIENLQPISLSSCVWKAIEPLLMNRCQRYLEEEDLFRWSMLSFRGKLCIQDAMIQLKAEIIDDKRKTRDIKKGRGLDLLSAFDNVKHSAILAQVNKLNLGERSYNYIRGFLTDRTAEIQVGDLKLEEKQLDSSGTSQRSVISPLLFNIVTISVGRRLEVLVDVRHTISIADITLWVSCGSNGFIEVSIQRAVDDIEDKFDGSGLICFASKSVLLVLPPKGAKKDRANGGREDEHQNQQPPGDS